MIKTMTRAARLAIVLSIILFLGGCAWLFPQTAALEKVHDTYRADFAKAFLPPEAKRGAPSCGGGSAVDASFADTLQAIHDYRVSYPNATEEKKHLLVLEGMIYLQIGQSGMATLLYQNNAQDFASIGVSGTGSYARDGLFAQNFANLIEGWKWVCSRRTSLANAGDPGPVRSAAKGIIAALTADKKANRLATSEADDGAVYLATTAGIFLTWPAEIQRYRCLNNRPPTPLAECSGWAEDYAAARDAVKMFLFPSEIEAAAQADQAALRATTGRLRYLAWYSYFACKAAGREDCK